MNSTLKKSTAITNEPESDSDDFVVQENKFQEDETGKKFGSSDVQVKRFGDEDEDDNHGALVKKILESKEQLEYGQDANRSKTDYVTLLFNPFKIFKIFRS